jgi:pimeloyl-ACP methyl ester carboxylesterase
MLHGGWGYQAYPFDEAFDALAPQHRVVAPDRVGYGGSDRLRELPAGFHPLMAEETMRVLDALGIERAALWGHSDGAVIAAWAAILHPERIGALVLEALHFFAAKTSSIPFFEMAIEAPHRFGPAVVNALERDHGEGWRTVIAAGGRAWLDIIGRGRERGGDLFDGRLGEVRAPTLLLHGRRDPRTEPGEIEAAVAALTPAGARCELLDAGHSPHTSAAAATRCVELASAFLAELE